jgi:hypothetical protein
MATIEARRQSAINLDIRKRRLEATIIPKIKAIFRDMAEDASNLYRATGNVPSEELADNYFPEFLKEVRDAMRRSIRRFGFNLRKSTEKKHGLFFDAENKASWIELEIKQTITIQDDDLDPKLDSINNDFLVESTLFVANEGERQTELITQTNVKELNLAVVAGIAAFSNELARRQNEVEDLSQRLLNAPPRQRESIRRQIEAVTRQIDASTANQQAIVAQNIQTNLLERAPARSDLIASQNVGLAESWARQTEAELIDDANLIAANGEEVNVVKSWQAILDSRTRATHVAADNQEVRVNESFIVGGESLKMPRDPNGSAGNIINCRCISDFEV